MKKIVSLILVLLTTVCMMGSVYAATNCSIALNTSKTEYNKNDEVVLELNMSNIQSDNGGVIAFGGTLEYDKDSLTLVKTEGQNGWSNASINNANGKFVMDRNGRNTNNETILKITFKVKETSKESLNITVKDATVADGSAPVKVSNTVKNITVKAKNTSSSSTQGTTGTNNNGSTATQGTVNNGSTTTQGTDNKGSATTQGTDSKGSATTQGTNSKGSTTTGTKSSTKTAKNKKNISTSSSLPKAGESNIISIIAIVGCALIAIISCIKIIRINKKTRK